MALPRLTSAQIEQIARVLGDTANGFTGVEIGHSLQQCGFVDTDPGITKWRRLFSAFCNRVNKDKSTNAIYKFLQYCFEPAQGINKEERYSRMMMEINSVLMLVGIEVKDDGNFYKIHAAQTLSEVQRRTRELRNKLLGYGTHEKVLEFCKEELLVEDYFHAVHEAAKSLCERIRELSGLVTDGTELVQTAMSLRNPYIAINSLRTSSEQNEQNGLKEMLCGAIHMYRNVTAHELRIRWIINEKDAVDALGLISYLHKQLDQCIVVPRYG